MEAEFQEILPFFTILNKEEKEEFQRQSEILKGDPGKVIVEAGVVCQKVYFVLEGSLRVFQLSEEGREMTLYRARKGEACLFSLTCIMKEEALNTITVVEKKAKLVGIPVDYFEKLMSENIEFQRYFLRRLLRKISSLMSRTEAVTFLSIEQRLAKYLQDHFLNNSSTTLATTHEKIAAEIGTAREVISRMLKTFQEEEVITLSRGKITLLSRKKLKNKLPL
ncbi:Crp/Fnr family transcriptional regulator [Isachenkonia alkalipeptolytica]|uniref:Crp/Fnr family transcriptional regulator n=1 Tax=Isachenkonia alkalipeptolytica TaxID=2565777 RepID=A0AA43XK28_9CLOT|nr:Crp/Fnr family transcriptional regulator [Isachenkonia alkalipeptolytica]NBG87811.1 Crp/Fnr family transcriptional regulator [Isachenkonia alkalipeptolytica]